MKNLFYVRDNQGKRVGGFFDKKPVAKESRDEMGGVSAGLYVSRGPDNIASRRGVPRMRRQPKAVEK